MINQNIKLLNSMVDPESTIRIELCYITPEWAEQVLEHHNDHNRQLSLRAADGYAEDMQSDAWPFIGDAIRFDKDHNLLDGQHRLQAVVSSGKRIKTLIIYNLDEQAQDFMDQGRLRTMGQILGLSGESQTALLAALLRRIVLWRRGGTDTRKGDVTRNEMLTLLSDESIDLIRDSVRRAQHAAPNLPASRNSKRIMSPSLFAFAYYITAQIDRDDADDFFDKLETGIVNSEADPVHVLRNKALVNLALSSRHSDTQRRQLALTFKAWNAYRQGEGVRMLRWRLSEEFPKPL